MIKSIVSFNQYIITLCSSHLIGYWSVEVRVWGGNPLQSFHNLYVYSWELKSTLCETQQSCPVWMWRLYLPAPMDWCFADTACLISQLEPIVLLLNEGWEMGGSLSKGTVAGSIPEFIKQLTWSHQYLFIITRFSGRNRCCLPWPYYHLVTDNSQCSSYFVVQIIWYTETHI